MSVITSVPYTISAAGSYTLGADLDMTNVIPDTETGLQIGIRIAPGVGNVNILGDIFSIRHNGGYGSDAVAIYGKLVADVLISNVNIFGQGMAHAVVIDNTDDPDYETIAIRNSVVSSRLIGISVVSRDAVVEDNLCRIIGRTDDPLAIPGGISVKALGGMSAIRRNGIWQMENSFNGEVFAIQAANSYRGVIEDNLVENNVKLPKSWAFWINNGVYTIARNSIKNFHYGFGLVDGSSGTIDATAFDNVDPENRYIPSSMPDLSTWTITNPSP